MNRIKTGISGLDKIMNGGIPENQLVLLTGTSGTGKTILCNQFMYTGIREFNQKGVYLSFEEPSELIKENVKKFGWDMDALESSGKLQYLKYDPYRIEDVFSILESTIRDIGAKRVVVDSISALAIYMRNESELRKTIFNLSDILRKLKCTSIMVSEIVHGKEPRISRFGVEEFVADSVIVMYYERIESTFQRAIQIWKLRGSTHSQKLHPYQITPKGIVVTPEEEAFLKT